MPSPSPTCADLVERAEGCALKAYDDGGVLAIGVGHTNRSGLPPLVTEGMTITFERAMEILRDDLQDVSDKLAARLSSKVLGWFTSPQWDALCSIAFNLGIGGLLNDPTPKQMSNPYLPRNLGLRPVLSRGDWELAERIIRFSVPPQDAKYWWGRSRRREAEARLFNGRKDWRGCFDLPRKFFLEQQKGIIHARALPQ